MMEIGNTDHGHTLSLAEARSQLAIWAILTSPMILGDDPRNMSVSNDAHAHSAKRMKLLLD